MHLTMYNTQLIAILNTWKYMYFHIQQPVMHNGLRFNVESVRLLKSE